MNLKRRPDGNLDTPSLRAGQQSLDPRLVQKEALGAALKAARAGREVLLHHFGRLEQVEKKHLAGLVSEADKNSEKAIVDVLKKYFPQSEILGEEETALSQREIPTQQAGASGRWIIDPLDGTTNYIHRFPIYCISIAFELNGVIEAGVIDVPAMNETYTAIRGGGAFVNGRRLACSALTEFPKSLLATGFFPEDKEALQQQLKYFSSVVGDVRGIRRAGAAAYDLALVAAGVFDAFWEKNLKPWDMAAGYLLVEEAGGVVKTYSGEEFNSYKNTIIAGAPEIVNELVQRFSKA